MNMKLLHNPKKNEIKELIQNKYITLTNNQPTTYLTIFLYADSQAAAELQLHPGKKRGVVNIGVWLSLFINIINVKVVYCFYESVKTLKLVRQECPKVCQTHLFRCAVEPSYRDVPACFQSQKSLYVRHLSALTPKKRQEKQNTQSLSTEYSIHGNI